MTEAPSVYFPEKSPDLDTIYQNEVIERFYYWPPAITQTSLALNPSGLSSTNPDIYYTYSGVSWQYTTAARQKDGRYRNITLRTISGDPFLFYITTKMTTDDGLHHAGPVSVSGSYYTLTKYNSIEEAETNAVEFTPTMNSGIFTLANTEQARMITLSHRAVASGQSYRLYQFLPRTSIEVDDLSAEVIDVVTLRVSDSIVVSPTIPDKSITGAKILDGTVSGVLITPGTITANEIAATSITADKLQVNNLAALSTNTGSLNVTNTITVTSGQINAGLVNITQSGISIGNVATELTETNALRIYGKINPSGGNVVGMALYNNLNPTTPHAVFQTDFDNAVEIENLAPDGVTNINIPQGLYENSFNVWVADPVDPQFSVGYDYTDVRNELYLSNNLTMTEGNYANLKGTTTIQGDFYVKSTDGFLTRAYVLPSGAFVNVPTTVNGNLTVTNGNTSLRGNLSVTNAANTVTYGSVTSTAATFNVPTTVNGNAGITGTLGVNGNLSISTMTGGYILNSYHPQIMLTRTSNYTSPQQPTFATVGWEQVVWQNYISVSSNSIFPTYAGLYLIQLLNTAGTQLQYAQIIHSAQGTLRMSNYYGVGNQWGHTICVFINAGESFYVQTASAANSTVSFSRLSCVRVG